MKRFWIINFIIGLGLLIAFTYFEYHAIIEDRIDLLLTAKAMMQAGVIQVAINLLVSLIWFKKQTMWTILWIAVLAAFAVAEVFVYYGALMGMLGDM